MHGRRFWRRDVLGMLGASAALWSCGGALWAQESQVPKLGRYRVENATMWMRDLLLESASDYAVYEARGGPLYGRGTYSFDGQSVRFLTGPFWTMGYRGSSTVRADGSYRIILGNTVMATSID
jgi:hypothetical protein